MLHSNISRKSGPLVDIKLTKNNTAPFKKTKNKITYRTVHPSAWSQQILHFHLCPDLWVTDTSSFLFPACPPPPSSYRSSRHAQCILPTATLNTNPCHHDNENTTQKKEAWLYIFMSLKPHTQKKNKTTQSEDSCLYPPAQRSGFKWELSVVEVKGLWEGPFCKRKPFWKIKPFSLLIVAFSSALALSLSLYLVCVQHQCPPPHLYPNPAF